MKTAGYWECRNEIIAARLPTQHKYEPFTELFDVCKLDAIRDKYGVDLYRECYADVAREVMAAAELRAKIKYDRAKYKAQRRSKYETFIPKYDFGGGLPLVNAEYLLDLLELFPDCEIYAHENPIYPIYYKSAAGEAVLCPIRKSEKD